jgi:hypothetical protein
MATLASGPLFADRTRTPLKDLTAKQVSTSTKATLMDPYKGLSAKIVELKAKLVDKILSDEVRAKLEVELKALIEEARGILLKGTATASLRSALAAAEKYFEDRVAALTTLLQAAVAEADLDRIPSLGGALAFALEVYRKSARVVQAQISSAEAVLENALAMAEAAAQVADEIVDVHQQATSPTTNPFLVPAMVVGGVLVVGYLLMRKK